MLRVNFGFLKPERRLCCPLGMWAALELPKACWSTSVPPHPPQPHSPGLRRRCPWRTHVLPPAPASSEPPPALAVRKAPGASPGVLGRCSCPPGCRQGLRCSEALGQGTRLDSARERGWGQEPGEAPAERREPGSCISPASFGLASSRAPASSCWSGGPATGALNACGRMRAKHASPGQVQRQRRNATQAGFAPSKLSRSGRWLKPSFCYLLYDQKPAL